MWCGKCSLKMHKTLYLAIFLYSEKFISCMFYCTPEAVPSILCSIWQTTGCHTLSYTVISVWIQSTCQNCFGFFFGLFLYECISEALWVPHGCRLCNNPAQRALARSLTTNWQPCICRYVILMSVKAEKARQRMCVIRRRVTKKKGGGFARNLHRHPCISAWYRGFVALEEKW